MHHSHRAFSLVELSIVLVILGLLTGGILGGQSLIHAAELRAVSTEYNRYVTAAQTFRDKYFYLPGDMPNATSFWGIAGGTGSDATCIAVQSTTAATCNGNGDGRLDISTTFNDAYRFWQHLANAGLIEGRYTGAPGPSGAMPVISGTNINSPASKYSRAGWSIAHADQTGFADGGYNYWGPHARGNLFFFGAFNADVMRGLLMKPEDAWNIDTKMDDGLPGGGSVLTENPTSACSTSATAPSTYALSVTTMACALRINSKL
jgi:prepilin-type N-terminal cleavage/methylation domain-containing protein